MVEFVRINIYCKLAGLFAGFGWIDSRTMAGSICRFPAGFIGKNELVLDPNGHNPCIKENRIPMRSCENPLSTQPLQTNLPLHESQ